MDNTGWVILIDNELEKLASGGGARDRTMYRVPKPLREVKQKDFEPGLISFGLYNRTTDKPLTRADVRRMRVAHAFLETLGKTKSDFDDISKQVVPHPVQVRELYDDAANTMSEKEVRWLLTLDAIFLTSLYIDLVRQNAFPTLEESLSDVHGSLHVDVLLLENQIPISLIRNVLRILLRKNTETEAENSLRSFCKEVIGKYSRSLSIPGLDKEYTHAENVTFGLTANRQTHADNVTLEVLEGDPGMHLLDVLYKTICSGVNPDEDYFQDPAKFTPLKTASQLHAAGITFKGGARGISEVEFEAGWFTGTLYLPKLALDTSTEKLWRNLVAFEDVRSTSRQHDSGEARTSKQLEFMCYLELMDDLIDKDADVRLLRKGKDPVISQMQLGSEKEVANMFNTLRQHCGTRRSKKWNEVRIKIMAHYDKPYIKLLVEFQEKYISKPWIFLGVLAATVLLILTFCQTFYTMLAYYHPHSA